MSRIRLTGMLAVACVMAVSTHGAAASPRAEARAVHVAVYLVRGERVAPVRRTISGEPGVAYAALAALLRGPTVAERRNGSGSAIPAGSAVRSVVLRRGTATVDLSRRFSSGGGSTSMLLRVAQVV